jgi:hypothetical protein
MNVRILLLLAFSGASFAAEDTDFFERKVRPVLATKCQSCHGADKQFAALRLDSREALLKGGLNGPAAIPGQPDASLIIKAVKHLGPKMPMGSKLADNEIAAFEEWVRTGIAWPAGGKPAKAGLYEKLLKEHWAYQPVKPQKPPAGKAANAVDRFLAAKLAAAGLAKAKPADPRVLARRAAYVITGLPPTPGQLDKFLAGQPYEAFIDDLLALPRYGERWARHWMDVVRYAETYGYEWNYEIQGAWHYRDYLIRAFNLDVPYNQFVREHIAGDLLAKPRTLDGRNESALATAFYRLGEMGHDNCDQFRELRTDVVDNQIDTLTKAFQGVTVSCARCHDHKIDPIPTEDYYALYGILNSSRPVARTLETQAPPSAAILAIKSEIRRELATAWLNSTSTLGAELRAALAAKQDSREAANLASGLDPIRIDRWRKLLEREKVDLSDPLAAFVNSRETYEQETRKRNEFNREKFVTAADFTNGIPAGWTVDGLGLQSGTVAAGDFSLATEGGDAIGSIFQAGLFTNQLTDRLNGTLRSPILPPGKKYASLQLQGGKFAARRVIVDNCVIGEGVELINHQDLRWEKVSTDLAKKFPVYLELNTKSDNPRLPDRPGKFKTNPDESPRSYFGVTRVVYHDEDVVPLATLDNLARLIESPTPDRFESIVHEALRSWRDGGTTSSQVTWLEWLIQNGILVNSRNLTPSLRELTDRFRAAEGKIAVATVVAGMGDYDPGKDHPIFLAGSALNPGPIAPRHFLTLMPPALKTVDRQTSGRRELAEAIASPDNPLTARLMVNRIWHHTFGRGIVASTDDFGRNGAAPSHAELLDYLAATYIEQGWSTKKMLRLLLTSDAFRQSSVADAAAKIKDPSNALLSHYPVRRLEAEAVRDTLLAVSGRLDSQLYGPSIQPYRAEPQEHRRLFGGPLDGAGRRSIYVKITRMEGPRFLEIFDFPSPLQSRGNRDVTNVPPQALAMLNDPFVIDQAKVWAKRLVSRKDDTADARIAAMFNEALGRPATQEELAALRALALDFAQRYQAADPLNDEATWADVAHTIFNLKEFLYLR